MAGRQFLHNIRLMARNVFRDSENVDSASYCGMGWIQDGCGDEEGGIRIKFSSLES